MLRPTFIFGTAVALVLSACSAAGPKPLPSAAPTPTPSRSVATLVDLAQKQVESADIVYLQLFEDSKYTPNPELGQAWVDYRGKEPAARFQAVDKGKDVTVLVASGKSPLLKVEGDKNWVEVGPKTREDASFKELTSLVNFFIDPLARLGFTDKTVSSSSFVKVSEEKIGSTPVTHWKLSLPAGERKKEDPDALGQGLTDMSSALEIWVDASGFPVRILQGRKDFTYEGVYLKTSKDSSKFTRPKSEDILPTP